MIPSVATLLLLTASGVLSNEKIIVNINYVTSMRTNSIGWCIGTEIIFQTSGSICVKETPTEIYTMVNELRRK